MFADWETSCGGAPRKIPGHGERGLFSEGLGGAVLLQLIFVFSSVLQPTFNDEGEQEGEGAVEEQFGGRAAATAVEADEENGAPGSGNGDANGEANTLKNRCTILSGVFFASPLIFTFAES